jgi:hypothetical protein
MEFTKELFRENSTHAKILARQSRQPKFVLTNADVNASENGRIEVIGSNADGVFWFTDDYCMGVDLLPRHYVPCSFNFPMRIVPRPGLEDGIIANAEQYIQIFEEGMRQITSFDELIEHLNSKYSI